VGAVALLVLALSGQAEAQDALASCATADVAVEELGHGWEAALAEAGWDPLAEGPRRFAADAGPRLSRAFMDRRLSGDTRRMALGLLANLRVPEMRETYRTMLASDHCPPTWVALAAQGIGYLLEPGDRERLARAFVLQVPSSDSGGLRAPLRPPRGRAPRDAAWALCSATARAYLEEAEEIPPEALDAARRLFVFGPQVAVEACMPMLRRLPDAVALAHRVLDGDDWPVAVEGPDPRIHRMLGWYGRGGALLLLAAVRGPDALERLEAALEDRDPLAAPTRDGAVQGLAMLAGPDARRILRGLLADDELRTPRVAHALLRLGDVASAEALRAAALDARALVEVRVSAASAYTLLAPGRAGVTRRWERDLARAAPLGPPFEPLDARMAEMGARLAIAERCRGDQACLAEALTAADVQGRARAFFELARAPSLPPEAEPLLAEVSAMTLTLTPPNEQHDVVAGAIALLARLPAALAHAHLPSIRRARVAWEGRTNPMGLPFDIPLALGELERRATGR
jgi:hypothetical protein